MRSFSGVEIPLKTRIYGVLRILKSNVSAQKKMRRPALHFPSVK